MVELLPCSGGWIYPALVYPRKFFSALIRAFFTIKFRSFVCSRSPSPVAAPLQANVSMILLFQREGHAVAAIRVMA